VAGCYGRGNPPFSSVNCCEFLSDCYLLKKECAHGAPQTQYMRDEGGWGMSGIPEGRNKLHGSLTKQTTKPQWRSRQPGENLFTPQPDTRSWRLYSFGKRQVRIHYFIPTGAAVGSRPNRVLMASQRFDETLQLTDLRFSQR
jgi:hypothetical protein